MGTDVPNHGGLAPCRHETPKEGCHVCHLWTTSKRHRVAWGGPAEYGGPVVGTTARAGGGFRRGRSSTVHAPRADKARDDLGLVVAYYDPKIASGQSHSGLGVNAVLTVEALAAAGVRCEAVGIRGASDLNHEIESRPWATHVTVGAAFVPPGLLLQLADAHKSVTFIPRCHSQLGYLQCETEAVGWFRQYEAAGRPNVFVSVNNKRLADYWAAAYGRPCVNLENPYPFSKPSTPRKKPDGFLDVGSFGSHRHLKNFLTAAGASLVTARRLGKKLRFHMNSGRQENNGGMIRKVVADLLAGEAELVELPWATWPEFRAYMGKLDLCVHPSFTETFSIVTADAVAEGVPVVVSPAVEWIPDECKADPDDPCGIADVAGWVLRRKERTAKNNSAALRDYNVRAVKLWLEFMERTKPARAPKRERRTLPCVHLGDEVGHEGSRTVYECDAGHGNVRSCIECQRCDDYVAEKD